MESTRIELLDHGYCTLIESYGSDESIIRAARMSTDKGFLGWGPHVCPRCAGYGETYKNGYAVVDHMLPPRATDPTDRMTCQTCKGVTTKAGDEKLLAYLWEHKHVTPFEMAGLIIEVQAPVFVFRQWHRHRTQCLAGDTMLHFQRPVDGRVYKMPIAEVWRKWQPTVRESRPERQTNAYWNRSRIEGMSLRCVNEETKEITTTNVVDVVKSTAKQLYRVTTIGGRSIRASADHRMFTDQGWLRLEEAVKRGASLAVESTAKAMAESWEMEPIDYAAEMWRDVVDWEGLYEVSNYGRVRRCGKPPRRGTVGRHGYPVVSLNRPGMQSTRTVHTLVLEAWHGSRPVGHECRHLNSNRVDARASNLRWGTPKENAADRVQRGSQQGLGVIFDEIREYVKAGFEETYDIAVADPWHNFIADGICVHNSYNEMSARYVPLLSMPDFMPTLERCIVVDGKNKQARTATGRTPTHEEALAWLEKLGRCYEFSHEVYSEGLEIGIPKEIARCSVTVAKYSRMRAHANLRNWLAFLTLRMDSHAQEEIRLYANAVGTFIKKEFPRTWELFAEGMNR